MIETFNFKISRKNLEDSQICEHLTVIIFVHVLLLLWETGAH